MLQHLPLSRLMTALFLLLLAACDRPSSPPAAQGGTDTPAPQEAPAGALVVGFSQIGAESAWRTANTQSIRGEAESRGVRLVFADAQQKQENQIKALRSFIAQKVDVIALSPVVETGWEPVLREIKEAGIPVILTDRTVTVSDESLFATFIGADFVEEGRRAAKWLAAACSESALIAELQGTPGSAPAIDRKRGFDEILAVKPGMKVIFSQSGEFSRSKGKEVMDALLKTTEGKRITAVYAHNDDMALGAIQAIEEAGRIPGKEVLVVSIDGVRDAFKAMTEGKLNCTIECTPLIGPMLFDAADKLHRGESIAKRIVTPAQVFDQAQAAAALPARKY